MTTYNYTGYKNGTNEIVKGKIDAENMREARAGIRNLGYIPTSIVEENAGNNKKKKKEKYIQR